VLLVLLLIMNEPFPSGPLATLEPNPGSAGARLNADHMEIGAWTVGFSPFLACVVPIRQQTPSVEI